MEKIFLLLILLPLLAIAQPNAVVYDVSNNQVIDGSYSHSEVSIASISKFMTVYTVLQENQDLNERLVVVSSPIGSHNIRKGMVLSRSDLINLALISSDNLAAQTLAYHFPGGFKGFVDAMNQNCYRLGMTRSGFIEPTGLSPANYSTVEDVSTLTRAVSEYEIVRNAAQSQYAVTYTNNGKKIVELHTRPTIQYFGKEGVTAIKTGFTNAAGFCVTMLVRVNDQLYNIIVLGARTKQERESIIQRFLGKIKRA